MTLLLAPLVALIASILFEFVLLRPRANWRRPLACWLLHAGIVLAVYVAGLALFQRPVFAAAQAMAWYVFILVVNRVKLAALREPFVFQDFEYFSDLLRHPRLYLPFFGYVNALLGIAGAALLISAGVVLERSALQMPGNVFWMALVMSVVAVTLLLGLGWRRSAGLAPSFDAGADMTRFGLIPCLCLYARAERTLPVLSARFAGEGFAGGDPQPHLVAVQSESFFDARRVWPDIAPDVYAWLDEARRESSAHGLLSVPAWGANTVRSEFAFLSGLREEALGAHRFNPYRRLREVKTLAMTLRESGYRTVCVHPYSAGFYRRDRVFPAFGFDEFIDVSAFSGADRSGPYIGDVALAQKVSVLLEASAGPLFVFVITMENHGPLHLERVDAAERAESFVRQPDGPCDELTIYLRHIRNAGLMWQRLRACMVGLSRESRLCWYGDHVPILPREYAQAGFDDARTDYFICSSATLAGLSEGADRRDDGEAVLASGRHLSDLAMSWLGGESGYG